MIGLSTKDFAVDGSIVYRSYQQRDLYKNSRRYQRVATLDGGMAFELRGLFNADKEFSLTLPFSDRLASLLLGHSNWTISSIEGCYEMFLAGWNVERDNIVMELKGL
jgi:hypothetical protein